MIPADAVLLRLVAAVVCLVLENLEAHGQEAVAHLVLVFSPPLAFVWSLSLVPVPFLLLFVREISEWE